MFNTNCKQSCLQEWARIYRSKYKNAFNTIYIEPLEKFNKNALLTCPHSNLNDGHLCDIPFRVTIQFSKTYNVNFPFFRLVQIIFPYAFVQTGRLFMGLYLLRVTWDFLYLFRSLILLNLKPEFALAIFPGFIKKIDSMFAR